MIPHGYKNSGRFTINPSAVSAKLKVSTVMMIVAYIY